MRIILIIIVICHAIVHLLSLLNRWNTANNQMTARIVWVLWFTAFLFLCITATWIITAYDSWWIAGFAAVLLSQSLIFYYWKDARWGTLVNVIILAAALLSFFK